MQTIEITKREINLKDFVKRTALESDCSKLIDFDCLITENGVPKILYKKIESDTKFVRQACKNIKYDKDIRLSGIKTESKIFGYAPRNTIRRDYCTATSLTIKEPLINAVITDFGTEIAKYYTEYFPDVYNMHSDIVKDRILPEWQIPKTPFTSGIVNKNNPLKYHFDAGNIKNVFSNMIVFKNGIGGGYLSCPEYNITFEAADNTCILFDGQNILHGVTPIKKQSDTAYRYSIVYYTLATMWNCLPINEEIIRARKTHLKREVDRANGITKELQKSK